MRAITILTMLIGLPVLTACSVMQVEREETTPPFGSSVRSTVQSQYVNPEPAGDAPVTGMDGRYADKVFRNYEKGPSGNGKQTSGGLLDALVGDK
ncbi:hypothetical protein [Pseudodesulfovibrio tunisiensis]|uniref:hypothetical protein n=1 Tax=Pseudodesulfovibrio tunisiensis TaxID=463192 RepID=UPI001FB56C84|nr:hypothetical protein [Pseudodesulfovibrio tunisiensis]